MTQENRNKTELPNIEILKKAVNPSAEIPNKTGNPNAEIPNKTVNPNAEIPKKAGCPDRYEFWLSALTSLSGRKKIHMKRIVPAAEEIYRMEPEELQRRCGLTEKEKGAVAAGQNVTEAELDETAAYCSENGIKLICFGDRRYPSRLEHICNPPYGLFFRGGFPRASAPSIAVVGARNCSAYGKKAAEQIGFELARRGISVISGMALGIDGAGHLGALWALKSQKTALQETDMRRDADRSAGSAAQRIALQKTGRTYGILGCGADICYPARHRELYEELIKQGGVISEYPPHTRPRAMFFPQRNRLISGLCDGVIVVEAREKSGALITADFALEQGKEVYAVPGRISDPLSQGTNRLIRQGAGIFLSAEDFLKEMDIFTAFKKASDKKPKLSLEKSERLVYSCLDLSPKNLDMLLTETMISFPELMENLESLREKGCILEVYHNYYIRSELSDFS